MSSALGQRLLSSFAELAKRNRHEPGVAARLKQIQGDVFWDIGANIGFYSFLLRKNFKRIIAVEPNPKTAYMLRKRINFFVARNIEVKELALSNRRGSASFYSWREWNGPGLGNLLSGISNPYSSDSLLPKAASMLSRRQSATKESPFIVFTQKFDDLSAGPVDLVKIDVEPELLVLEGMKKNLGAGLIRYLLVELHDLGSEMRIRSFLSGYGYEILWVDPRHILARLQPQSVSWRS